MVMPKKQSQTQSQTQTELDELREGEVPAGGESTTETETEDTNESEGEGEGEGEGGEEELTPEQLKQRIEDVEAELQRTRRALKKANREAAQRRLALKAQGKTEGEGEGEDEEVAKLRQENERLKAELEQHKRERLINQQKQRILDTAKAIGFRYPEDALALGGVELGETEEDAPTDEEIRTALRQLARRRPELLKEKEVIDADSQRRGGSDSLLWDEEQIAQQFGIRNFRPTKKE